ncbi:hypothetical protein PBAL39_05063 [Pedobacter sp. BAL39]|nr:hypothetical protein PBAL39_05063 [Pedobacter sp. BAL39]
MNKIIKNEMQRFAGKAASEFSAFQVKKTKPRSIMPMLKGFLCL